MSYFAHHFVGVRVGKEKIQNQNRKNPIMKFNSVLLLVIASFAVLLTSVVTATAGEYRYRGYGDEYGYYQQRVPRAQVVTRKVWYRNSYGHLCVRYVTETIIPARACVAEVYEAPVVPYYYSGSYSFGGGYRDSTNIRLQAPRLPNLPQPHKEIGKLHKEHQNAVKSVGKWIKDRF